MNDFLDQMIRTDREGHPLILANKLGVSPVYFTPAVRPDPDECFDDLIDLSRQFWTYLGYSGLMVPWHDENPFKLLRIRRDKFREWLLAMREKDIHWKSYCVLSFVMTRYEMWERPTLLIGQRLHWTRLEKFRKYAGSSQRVDDVAFFMLEFIQLQVEHVGRTFFGASTFTEKDTEEFQRRKAVWAAKERKRIKEGKPAPKKSKDPDENPYPLYLGLYHRIADRIGMLERQKIDYIEWLRAKFEVCKQMNQGKAVPIKAIVNVNSFDPDLGKLQATLLDPWRAIRNFLGLSPSCEFPDGCVPRGWRPASDDGDDTRKISRIMADGYYYYPDGVQRRGKRHHANNKYLTIKVSSENFVDHKSRWDDARLLVGAPSWEDYSTCGLYPGIWNEEGTNISEFRAIKDVRWRKR